jgi:hypothetical protein
MIAAAEYGPADAVDLVDIVGIVDRDRLAEPAVLTDVRQARDE